MKAFLEPTRLFKFMMWVVAVLFAWFLMGLGGLVIRDLPRAEHSLSLAQFETPPMRQLAQEQEQLKKTQNRLSQNRQLLTPALDAASSAYAVEYSNFQNWISTRNATGSAEQSPQLVTKTRQLEQLKAKEQIIREQIEAIDKQEATLDVEIQRNTESYSSQQAQTQKTYERAVFQRDLKIFALRLLLILPLLVIAIWLFTKKRQSKYWPFVWGFIFFSGFSFFVELVPYMPSFGGYIRYVVGLLLVVVAGRYGIDWMQGYLLRRQAEVQATETERRKKLNNEEAIKRIIAHVCPGCERGVPESKDTVTNFCMYCSLQLYRQCKHCSTRHNAFFPYCPTCGAQGEAELSNVRNG